MAICDIEYNGRLFDLSYDIVNYDKKEAVLFLHGWGSNKKIMEQPFKDCLKDFKQIYLDMPGFGASINEDAILTTKDYANIIKNFLNKIETNPKIIIGHSFGGKVATLLEPKCLVLLSTAGILVPKPFKVKFKIALFKLLKPFGIVKFRKLFVSDDAKEMNQAMYETFKNVVDEDFSEIFANFKNRAIIFWGKEDSATPLWCGKKINELIQNSSFLPLPGDHYFFLESNNAKKICNKILIEYRNIDD